MPIALAKVAKKIRAKKGGRLDQLSVRHTNKLNRATQREAKLRRLEASRSKTREPELVRVGYFKVATKDTTEPLSIPQTRDLIERWVHRNDEELCELQKARRPGRPPSAKEDSLKQSIAREMEEFRTGFYVPDLQDWANIEWLQRWDGSVGALAQIRFKRIAREDSEAS
ncbi:translation machinery-associated protein 16 [Tuber borchii]|uniref:Translation machinery-associated protein 16 n=1 Tax=Tuber borchii TaxID=42251 RepID=A0A2T6ZE80_TUBBO|nr:translation machinery-associated protein 16 [Tuber borchii]